LDLAIRDLITYNTDIKISGNQVEVRHYEEKDQIRGYLVTGSDKKSLQAKYEARINGFKKELSEKINGYFHNEISNQAYTSIIEHLKKTVIPVTIENKKNNFYKCGRRAKTQIMDLVACNVYKWKDYSGKKQKLKFLTLGFDPKLMTHDLLSEYPEKQFEKFEFTQDQICDPKKILTNYKWVYHQITTLFKRLSYHHFKVKKNVIKYICVPELHKNGEAFHFHIIIFNMPYTNHSDLYGNHDQLYSNGLWGWGSVNIQAVTGSAGRVGKYVAKYITKNHDDVEGKENPDNDHDATFETYQRMELENMKRYSTSRGLYKPIKRYAKVTKKAIAQVINYLRVNDALEVLNKEGDKIKVLRPEPKVIYDDNGQDVSRGRITYYSFRINDKNYLNHFKELCQMIQDENITRRNEKWKSIGKLSAKKKHIFARNELTEKEIEKRAKSLRVRYKKAGGDLRNVVVDVNRYKGLVFLRPLYI